MQYLKTPISYYGGKQKLASLIIKNIPEHILYCEPFLGGAAVYFLKSPSQVEVINDTNKELINFYQVCKNRFHDLSALVRITLHSRLQHDDAWSIYNKPHLHDEVRRAWAVWVLSTQSFSAKIDGSWGYDKSDNTTSKKVKNKAEQFSEELAFRLQHTQIECADALYIIQSRDQVNSFFYCDPPYYNSNMGHYDGYSEADYEALLKQLSTIKGKFLVSSYPSKILDRYIQAEGWQSVEIKQSLSACGAKHRRTKIEVLTANYKIKLEQEN